MDRLVSVIGPAPSELNYEDLITKLRTERERISRSLVALRQPSARKAKAVAKKTTKTLSALAKQHGLAVGDLQKLLEKELAGK